MRVPRSLRRFAPLASSAALQIELIAVVSVGSWFLRSSKRSGRPARPSAVIRCPQSFKKPVSSRSEEIEVARA